MEVVTSTLRDGRGPGSFERRGIGRPPGNDPGTGMKPRLNVDRIHSPGSPKALAENVVVAFMVGLVSGAIVAVVVIG